MHTDKIFWTINRVKKGVISSSFFCNKSVDLSVYMRPLQSMLSTIRPKHELLNTCTVRPLWLNKTLHLTFFIGCNIQQRASLAKTNIIPCNNFYLILCEGMETSNMNCFRRHIAPVSWYYAITSDILQSLSFACNGSFVVQNGTVSIKTIWPGDVHWTRRFWHKKNIYRWIGRSWKMKEDPTVKPHLNHILRQAQSAYDAWPVIIFS